MSEINNLLQFNFPYLKDEAFLLEVDNARVRELTTRLILLNWQEQPVKEIQGRTTDGSINIDGSSSMRRTASVSLVLDEDSSTNYSTLEADYSLNKKVAFYIGLKNMFSKYQEYDTIWFPLGIYIISDASISRSSSGVSVSLNLKDKMCLLSGDCGGMLPASVTFDEREEYNTDEGTYLINKVKIYDIILELVNHFGGEQLGKIIISDVPERIKAVMKWTGNNPIYVSKEGGSYYYNTLPVNNSSTPYGFGEDVGYIYTDFVYPGELIGNAGDSVCSVLDQIRDTLGNFEYFYDVYGNFVFQEIKNYLNTTQAQTILNNMTFDADSDVYNVEMGKGKSVYSFDNGNLITSYNNNPNYDNIKNDFIIWGKRKCPDGTELPIRYHLAVDRKPELPTTARRVKIFKDGNDDERYAIITDNTTGEDIFSISSSDWRTELLLQGAAAESAGTDPGYYYTELLNEWHKLYDIKTGQFTETAKHKSVNMDYYLDFIDTNSDFGKYSIDAVGRRTEVLVDDTINCIFEPEIPNTCLIETGSKNYEKDKAICELYGENITQINQYLYSCLEMGGVYNSAFNAVKDLLYQHTSYNETISLSCAPIYHLEPNSRITVKDESSGIDGDYVIKSLSVPLDINGTMSISANRAMTKI